jgi:predicted chitinase
MRVVFALLLIAISVAVARRNRLKQLPQELASEVFADSEVADASISLAQLRAIMTGLSSANAQKYLPALNSAMAQGNINTCPRKSAFIAQLAHESGQLRYWEELASGKAYEGRKDLGNTHPGDGVRFKGRGPIQLTGRNNYRAAGKALGMDLENNPTLVATTDVGFRTSLWFWNYRSLNNYADQNTQSAFDTITRRINGGTNGKADRDQFWRKAKSALGC